MATRNYGFGNQQLGGFRAYGNANATGTVPLRYSEELKEWGYEYEEEKIEIAHKCTPDCKVKNCKITTQLTEEELEELLMENALNEGEENADTNNNPNGSSSSATDPNGGGSGSSDEEKGSDNPSDETPKRSEQGNGQELDNNSGSRSAPRQDNQSSKSSDKRDSQDSSSEGDKQESDSEGSSGSSDQGDSEDQPEGKESTKADEQEGDEGQSAEQESEQEGEGDEELDYKETSVGAGDTGNEVRKKTKYKDKLLTDAAFHARLRNIMKDNSYDRRVKGRKRGKLDMRALHKVPAKSETVFTLKEARKNKKYNVILLIDQSASMYQGGGMYNPFELDNSKGTRIYEAAKAGSNLALALEKVGIDFEVVGYSDSWKVYKSFDQQATKEHLDKMTYQIRSEGRGGTRLSPALQRSIEDLRKREGRNIIVSLSDGSPGNPQEAYRLIKQAKRHDIEYIDISIAAGTLTRNGVTIDNAEQVKPAILTELQARIKRG